MKHKTAIILFSVILLVIIGATLPAQITSIPPAAGGGGAATSITVGTTTIVNGTTTRLLYDVAGVVGEYTNTALKSFAAIACADLTNASATCSALPTFAQISSATNTTGDMKCGAGCTVEPLSTGIESSNASFPIAATGANTTAIPVGSWSLQNGASAHCSYNDFIQRELVLACPSVGDVQGALTRAITVPYTLYAEVELSSLGINATHSSMAGITVSDGTKYESISVFGNSNTNASVAVHTQANLSQTATTTVTGTAVAGPTTNATGQTLAVKIVNNSTTRVWSYWSSGGWVQALSESSGTFVTETAAGVFCNNQSFLVECRLKFWSSQ